jgi:SAM-dependent methyltransferase
LHELLYRDGDRRYPRPWCSAATGFVVSTAIQVIEGRLAALRRGEVIRVLDYGAGTGLASIEFLKACDERGIGERLASLGASIELHLVDLPSSWFAQGFELLGDCPWTRFHSLRAPDGGFRALLEVTAGQLMDVVMSNMVFHLIPRSALARAATELAQVTRPGGRLVWSSPDLGPRGPYAVLFHDANRALRRRWLELLDAPPSDPAGMGAQQLSPSLRAAIDEVRSSVDTASLEQAQLRANRRVLPSANTAADVAEALAEAFRGEAKLSFPTYELLAEEALDTLLVPSNQAEYLPEIGDPVLRGAVVRELMLDAILPLMQEGPAATALGLNVQWTLGSVTRERDAVEP